MSMRLYPERVTRGVTLISEKTVHINPIDIRVL